jgi:hypothetical protein
MGLRDDAIREHLELKRRHGATSDELQQLEREALGPVRREEPLPADDADREAEPAPLAAEPPPEPEAPPEPEFLDEPVAHEPPPPEPAPRPREPEPEPELLEPRGEATAEWDVAEAFEEEEEEPPEHAEPGEEDEEPEGEDVLEETPDFLQETPEHDRLWFEQRPPRDFDFDS